VYSTVNEIADSESPSKNRREETCGDSNGNRLGGGLAPTEAGNVRGTGTCEVCREKCKKGKKDIRQFTLLTPEKKLDQSKRGPMESPLGRNGAIRWEILTLIAQRKKLKTSKTNRCEEK